MKAEQMFKPPVAYRAGNVGLLWSTVAMSLFALFVSGILVAMLLDDGTFRRLPPPTTTATTTPTTTTAVATTSTTTTTTTTSTTTTTITTTTTTITTTTITTTTTTITTATTTTTTPVVCLSSLTWTDEIVSSENTTVGRHAGLMPSIAVDSGEPYIFYTTAAPVSLWITQRNGSTWSDAEVDNRTAIEPLYRSLSAATVDGLPSAAYRLTSTTNLHFAQRNGTTNTVTDLETGGLSASMAVAGDGHPHIAHYSGGATALRLMSRNATAWSGQNAVAAATQYFGFAALAFVGGQPAIVYQDVTSFAPATSTINSAIFNGTSWTITLIESIGTYQSMSGGSVADANGTAVAVWERVNVTTPAQVVYGTFDGVAWSTSDVPDATSTVLTMYPSLAIVCDMPVLTYCNLTAAAIGDLCAVTVLDGTWTTKVTYDAASPTSATSVVALGDLPIAAFKAGVTPSSSLRYAEASLGP